MKSFKTRLPSNTPDRLLRWAGIGLLVWLAVLVLSAGAGGLRASGKAAESIRQYQRLQNDSAESQQHTGQTVRQLAQNNLFAAPPSRNALPQTQAILGDAVLIGDQWYRQGQEVDGYQIVAIGPDFVTVLDDGTQRRLAPFDVEVDYGDQAARGPDEERGGESREGRRGRRGPETARDDEATDAQTAGQRRRPPEEVRSRMRQMRERVESMTPEQRREMYQRYQNASPQEREQMREQFRRN